MANRYSIFLPLMTLSAFLGVFALASDFTHHEVLDERSKFHLHWKFDDEVIEFEAQVQTTGWVGLGLSPNGGMPGSDIVIGWVKDGKPYLRDHYAEGKSQPSVDESQDWELVSGYENETHTVLRFKRKLTNCDERDRDVTRGTMRVIWAMNDQDPESAVAGPVYHGSNRGTRSTPLLTKSSNNEDSIPESAVSFDIRVNNVSIPSDRDTLYWCKLIKIPELNQKHHIIAQGPLITPGNEGVVHHFIVYKCSVNMNLTILPEDHPGHECFTPNMPWDWYGCYGDPMFGWAVGQRASTYESHVGLPIGSSDESGYVLLEVHYDNAQLLAGLRDSSGMRMTYTPELREYDVGSFSVSVPVSDKKLVIPPFAEEFQSTAFCSQSCLGTFLEDLGEPIHVYSVTFHAHLLSVKMKLMLIRDGVETEIERDDYYDFNLQYPIPLEEELLLYPGDSLVLECTYSSSSKDKVVFGGIATQNEMCLVSLGYYPRMPLLACSSYPVVESTVGFAGVDSFTTDIERNEFEVLAPANMVGMSYREVMEGVPWTNEKARDFETRLTTGPSVFTCLATSQSLIDTEQLREEGPIPRGIPAREEDFCAASTGGPTVPAGHTLFASLMAVVLVMAVQ